MSLYWNLSDMEKLLRLELTSFLVTLGCLVVLVLILVEIKGYRTYGR